MARKPPNRPAKKSGPKPWIPTPKDCEKAFEFGARGLNLEGIASCFKCSVDTLRRTREKYPQFAERLDAGRNEAYREIQDAIFNNAIVPMTVNGVKRKGDPASQRLWLQHTQHLRDTVAIEAGEGSVGAAIVVLPAGQTVEQWQANAEKVKRA